MSSVGSRRYGWFLVIAASALLSLGLFNLVVNTRSIGSWLPLVILMPISLAAGIRRLHAAPPPPQTRTR